VTRATQISYLHTPKYLVNNMNYGLSYYEVRLQPARPFSSRCINILLIVLYHEIINLITYSRMAVTKTAFNKKRALFSSTLILEMCELVKCYIWSIALCGAETWTLRAVDQRHLEKF